MTIIHLLHRNTVHGARICLRSRFRWTGGAADAQDFNDLGANTLGHIAEFCAAGLADRKGLREGPLCLPHMSRLGLVEVITLACGQQPAAMPMPMISFSARLAVPMKYPAARTRRPVTGRLQAFP